MALTVILSGFSLAAKPASASTLICLDACANDCDYTCDDPSCTVKDCQPEPCHATGGVTMDYRAQCTHAS
jgi:hypothetical protein